MTREQKRRRSARGRQYYWRNREKILAKARLYYIANREEIIAANAEYKRAFGKSTSWYVSARKAAKLAREVAA